MLRCIFPVRKRPRNAKKWDIKNAQKQKIGRKQSWIFFLAFVVDGPQIKPQDILAFSTNMIYAVGFRQKSNVSFTHQELRYEN